MTKKQNGINPADKILTSQINTIIKGIMKQREGILKAFVAETGLKPSECEQIIETDGTLIRWYIRKQS